MSGETSEEKESQIMPSVLGNMALAHEMIMNDNFKLSPIGESHEEKSLYKHVHDIVHQAFWDVLQSEITSIPPQYSHALTLLKELKELLIGMINSKQVNLLQMLNEGFDLELIQQQISHEVFDIHQFGNFILSILSKLCAPARDDKIEELQNMTDTVQLLRGIFELVNLMKLDMANYEIQALKPLLLQQAVEYEREKFASYLKEHPAALTSTTTWLQKAHNRVISLQNKTNTSGNITSGVVITDAYLSLIEPTENVSDFPETLLMDINRLNDLSTSFHQITYIASIVSLLLNQLGQHYSTDQLFVDRIKNYIKILISNSRLDEDLLERIHDQLVTETDKEFIKKGIERTPSGYEPTMLKLQMIELIRGDNPLNLLIKSKIRDYVLLSMSSPKLPSMYTALKPIQNELNDIARKFLRVINHNKRVYLNYYTDIISKFNDKTQELL